MVTITMDQLINFRDNGGFFADAHLPLKGAYKLISWSIVIVTIQFPPFTPS